MALFEISLRWNPAGACRDRFGTHGGNRYEPRFSIDDASVFDARTRFAFMSTFDIDTFDIGIA
jgi:hypothetical protein